MANIYFKNKRRIGTVVAVTVLFASLAACGYHFKGAGLKPPQGVRTIAITVLENRTSESGIERVFTNDLTFEFTRSKVLRLVGKDKADAILSGIIKSMGEQTISHTASYDSGERRVVITLDLTLKSQDGGILWSDAALSDREVFKVFPDDRLATDRSRREAIEAISERLAEKAHNRIFTDF
jgi:outer membrane lipopolysaccharide assembly protein LptE/RlpB